MTSTRSRWWRGERAALTTALVAMVALPAGATPTVIGFEGLSDLEVVDTQFLATDGVTFANAVALQEGDPAGGSLNELGFRTVGSHGDGDRGTTLHLAAPRVTGDQNSCNRCLDGRSRLTSRVRRS